MERQQLLQKLRDLRDQIVALQIVKCRMAHEQVVCDPLSGLPVIRSFPEGSYRRVGLCNAELRANRLGCSHTSARIPLDDAINLLGTVAGKNRESIAMLRSEANGLNNEIHLLDHCKGDAEKRLAEILEEAHRAGKSPETDDKRKQAERAIAGMEAQHDEFVERIGLLRDRIVQEIDQRIHLNSEGIPSCQRSDGS